MHSRRHSITAAILATALTLATAACGSESATPSSSASGSSVALFGTDGIMSNSFGDTVKSAGLLDGLSGTSALDPPNATFDDDLLKINHGLDDFSYAGQAYDAVVITALAAQVARSTDGRVIAKYIDGITQLAKGGVICDSFAACLGPIAQGKDIAYRGITVNSGFTSAGEPSTASYGTLHFGPNNHIDVRKTEFLEAGDSSGASKAAAPKPAAISYYGGPALNLGVLLPKTGQLAAQGKPIIAAAEMAIAEVNTAGGVLSRPVATEFADDATDPAKAVAGAKSLIETGANAIIGPSFSGASDAVIPVAAAAGVVLFSPSATAAALSTVADHGMFFRTAPSDLLQAQAVADVITRSGAQRVFVVARSDSYGTPFAHDVTTALEADGLATANVTTAGYSAAAKANNADRFSEISHSVVGFHANAVLLIGYEEVGGMISALSAAGVPFRTS